MTFAVDTSVLETTGEYKRWRRSLQAKDKRPLLGFVPTMGALHDGHLSLVRQAAKDCQNVVVSIFVNPLQFGANEDFAQYPRPFEQDLELCREAGVTAVFHPKIDEFYSLGILETTRVVPPPSLVNRLCGVFRPGHFEGVTTVVMKLFGLAEPNNAYFGEKDYQQLTIVKRMVSDLNVPVTIINMPTVRESDGLAMSSRNAYLTAEERKLAPQLYEALTFIRDRSLSQTITLQTVLQEAKEKLSSIPGLTLQYLEVCDTETLEPLKQAHAPMVILIAAKLGRIRLIDNLIVG